MMILVGAPLPTVMPLGAGLPGAIDEAGELACSFAEDFAEMLGEGAELPYGRATELGEVLEAGVYAPYGCADAL